MLRFRPATEKDIEGIANLHARSWQQNYRGALSDDFLDNKASDERLKIWKSRLKKENADQLVIVAETNHKIVGFVCVMLNQNEEYGSLLDNLHVSSDMQGRGLGHQLMYLTAKEIEQKLPNSAMYLWVLEQNVGAIRFYEGLGGVKVETVEEMDIGDRPVVKSRYYWKSLGKLMTEK